MQNQIKTEAVHHLRLTVTNVDRSREFYTDILGFKVVKELPSVVMLSNGSVMVALGTSPHPDRAITGDRFDENRVGLDHLSFSVSSRNELEHAVRLFDEKAIPRGEITDLGQDFEIYILVFRDPDNIQLELTAPYN
jgi:glyoxylase I family protein